MRPGAVRRGTPAAAALPDGSDQAAAAETPHAFHVRKKQSNVGLWAGVAVVCAGLGVGGYYMLAADSSAKPDAGPSVASVAKQPVGDPPDVKAQRKVDAFKEYLRAHPDEYEEHFIRLTLLTQNEQIADHPAGREAQAIYETEKKKWLEGASRALAGIMARVNDCFQNKKPDGYDFVKACEITEERIPILEFYRTKFQWERAAELDSLRKDYRQQLAKKGRLEELFLKASQYATRNENDIAELILLEFGKESEPGTRVREVYDYFVAQIQSAGIAAYRELSKASEAKRKALEEEKARADAEARRQAWTLKLAQTRWVSQIAKSNLYNWISNQGNWQLAGQLEDGVPVIIGRNVPGASGALSLFHDHWLDYALRFEWKATAGDLDFSPRSSAAPGSMQSQSELITLPSAELAKSKWNWVTIFVRGSVIQIYKDNEGKPENLWKEIDAGDEKSEFRLNDHGGFSFHLPEGAEVALRNIQTKLISHNRKRLY